MSIKREASKKMETSSKDYFDRPAGSAAEKQLIFKELFKNAASWARSYLNAQVRLRNCITGRMVTVKGRPQINAAGQILIGSYSRIWSDEDHTKISAGPNALIDIGENTFINSGASIFAARHIHIGNNCHIANRVVMMDSDYNEFDSYIGTPKSESIYIENDVYIAARVVILKGVHIGEGAIVAAGATVTENVPPYTFVAGSPAKVIKRLDGGYKVQKLMNQINLSYAFRYLN